MTRADPIVTPVGEPAHARGAVSSGEASLHRPAISVLRKRADFLKANHGLRAARKGFVLLAVSNDRMIDALGSGSDDAEAAIRQGRGKRYGITVTKKIGNAVLRNRIKRRFRALLRAALPGHGPDNHDYVMIGRSGAETREFAAMQADLESALAQIAKGKSDPVRGRGGKNRSSKRKPRISGGRGK